MNKQKHFLINEVDHIFAEIANKINKRCMQGIAPQIARQLGAPMDVNKYGTYLEKHGTYPCVLQFHCWVDGQRKCLQNYFKYEVQHDHEGEYTGTAETNWAIQFYMNKTRMKWRLGKLKREAEHKQVIGRVSRTLQQLEIELEKFKFEDPSDSTPKIDSMSLIYRFHASSSDELKSEIYNNLPSLINAAHPMYHEIVDDFGI